MAEISLFHFFYTESQAGYGGLQSRYGTGNKRGTVVAKGFQKVLTLRAVVAVRGKVTVE